MTIEDLKADLDKTLGKFRETNDAALAEAKAHGKTSGETQQKVEALNGRIDEIKDQIKTLSTNVSNQITNLALGGRAVGGDEPGMALAAFNAGAKTNLSAEQFAAYQKAFATFARKGDQSPDIHAAMSVGYEQGGGVWVPPSITGPMQKKLYETSPMRQLCNVVTISTDALEGMIDNDEVDSGWVAEQEERPDTKTPEVGKYRIDVHEQYAQPKVTQQLLDDAVVNVEAWLGDKIADKFSRRENTAFVIGNGSKRPRGFLDYTKVETDDKTRKWDQLQYIRSGKADGFAVANPADAIIDLIYALKAQYRTGAAFVGARPTFGTIRKLKDGQGNYLSGATIKDGAFVETIMGFPVVEADDMPLVAANAFPLAFGNFKAAYIIVDRQGVRLLRDPYTSKPYVKFYTTKRVGGGLVNGEAIKLLKVQAPAA